MHSTRWYLLCQHMSVICFFSALFRHKAFESIGSTEGCGRQRVWATSNGGRWIWVVRRIRRIFCTILGGWPRQELWRFIRGNLGNILIQFNSSRIMDTGHFIGTVLSIGAAVECIVPAILVSHCSFHWRPILCTRSYAKLFCNQPVSFALYIWHLNGCVGCSPFPLFTVSK